MAIKKRALGHKHPEVGLTLNNLAALYQAQAKWGKAAQSYRRSLRIFERTLGEIHPHTATSLYNYAGLLAELGKTEEAARLTARADTICAGGGYEI